MALEGAEPCPALLILGFSSALNPSAKQENVHLLKHGEKRDVPVRFSFLSLCEWLAGCGGAEEIALDSERKENWTFSPLP